MRYLVVDVFTNTPLAGNALAVFPDPDVPPELMQKIARETNLSETTFVQSAAGGVYSLRIFTPGAELPFAGHPTLGTAWTLRHLGRIEGETVTQQSAAGDTRVTFEDDLVWLERTGAVGHDFKDLDAIAHRLGVSGAAIGFNASLIGGADVELWPAFADAGVQQLMVPIADPSTLSSIVAPMNTDEFGGGLFCFAPLGHGRIKARFFGASLGVVEDPATGSASAGLGLYVGARSGALRIESSQGAEIARPSTVHIDAGRNRVRVGGSVVLVAEGSLTI